MPKAPPWVQPPWKPERPACCGEVPTDSPDCIDKLIDAQTSVIAQADRAKSFKAELVALQQKARKALEEYTPARHEELVERWKKQDRKIAELIAKFTCTVRKWRWLVDCRVCPLLCRLLEAERLLAGRDDKARYDAVHSLLDLRYWWERERDVRRRRFEDVKNVLAAWEKPGASIDKVLNDNAKLIDDIEKGLGLPDAARLVVDLFLHLVPMHLLVAPPASVVTTAIDRIYTDLCACDDTGTHDYCCGADTGTPGVLHRLLGPQPYLVGPDRYYAVVCCLLEHRFLPAKDALAQAEGELESTKNRIDRLQAELDERRKSLDKDARAELLLPIPCKDRGDEGAGDCASDGGHDHGSPAPKPGASAAA